MKYGRPALGQEKRRSLARPAYGRKQLWWFRLKHEQFNGHNKNDKYRGTRIATKNRPAEVNSKTQNLFWVLVTCGLLQ